MTSQIFRFASLLAAAVALVASNAAWAQLTVTDGVTSKTSCTGYSVAGAGGSTTITLTPNNCLTATSSGTDPVFSVRVVPAATTQSSTSLQQVNVFVDADRDVPPSTTYSLTFNLCTSAQGCTSAGQGNWYFLRYAELGGPGMLPQHAITTGSFTFTFQPGANTSPTNLRSMGAGVMDVPNAPLFSGTRNVMFSLSGTGASGNIVTHTITGGQQLAGGDVDINGNPIPAPTGPHGVQMVCGYPSYLATTPYPGTGSGPCGAYEIPVGNCSSGMTGTNAITRAWMYVLEDYPGPRIGQAILAGIPRDQAMVFRFKTLPASAIPQTPYRNFGIGYSEQYTHGPSYPRFVTLSENKCDFDYTKTLSAGTLNGCFKNMAGDDSLLGKIWTSSSVPSPSGDYPYCPLKPDTTYYLNIRYEDARTSSAPRGQISCPAGQGPQGSSQCGQAILFQ